MCHRVFVFSAFYPGSIPMIHSRSLIVTRPFSCQKVPRIKEFELSCKKFPGGGGGKSPVHLPVRLPLALEKPYTIWHQRRYSIGILGRASPPPPPLSLSIIKGAKHAPAVTDRSQQLEFLNKTTDYVYAHLLHSQRHRHSYRYLTGRSQI